MPRPFARRTIDADIKLSYTVIDGEHNVLKFTATVCGYRNFHIATMSGTRASEAISKCREIRDRIKAGDEAIWTESMPFIAA